MDAIGVNFNNMVIQQSHKDSFFWYLNPSICKTNNIPLNLSCTLHLVPINKC